MKQFHCKLHWNSLIMISKVNKNDWPAQSDLQSLKLTILKMISYLFVTFWLDLLKLKYMK